TCSPRNDYPRAVSLRHAFSVCPGVDTLIVRNNHKGLLRYPEIALKLFKVRLLDRPYAYVFTFRGYETLLMARLTLLNRPVIFDELVNFTEWMVENGRLSEGSLAYRLFRRWNIWMTRKCRFILADTDAHAKYSAILNKLSIKKYRVLPVSAEEEVFKPRPADKGGKKPFTVLYYGHMVALHGLEYVLEAAELLKDRPDIKFYLAGGKRKGKVARACAQAVRRGAHLTHESWLPFERLPDAIHDAGLTLGGPFGGTLQADFVVTGKTYQVLACGEPVLIGRNRVNEGFVDKENCLVVPQADARALAEAIRWAADHPKELAQIGRAGRQLYEANFSQAAVNNMIQEIVAQL
ncbi:MAG TPA: glycosyltransferase, partial [Candidatus Saccharimonadales bacterium]|nr:glycosyltransferase [Candidatus Saccharimonadales bacterium]